jgi:hypothetical protein
MFSLEIIDIFYLVKKILVLPGLAAPRLARPRRAAPCILHLSVSGVKNPCLAPQCHAMPYRASPCLAVRLNLPASGVKKSLSRRALPGLAKPGLAEPRLAFYIFQSIQSIAVTSNLP